MVSRKCVLLSARSASYAAALALVFLLPFTSLSAEMIPLNTDSPDFFEQAASNGVSADFLSARSVRASIIEYHRPLVDILQGAEGEMYYSLRPDGKHSIQRLFYDPEQGHIVTLEYRFHYDPDQKIAVMEDIFSEGRALSNYAFLQYADELCMPR